MVTSIARTSSPERRSQWRRSPRAYHVEWNIPPGIYYGRIKVYALGTSITPSWQES